LGHIYYDLLGGILVVKEDGLVTLFTLSSFSLRMAVTLASREIQYYALELERKLLFHSDFVFGRNNLCQECVVPPLERQ